MERDGSHARIDLPTLLLALVMGAFISTLALYLPLGPLSAAGPGWFLLRSVVGGTIAFFIVRRWRAHRRR
jgi:amino acid transporter